MEVFGAQLQQELSCIAAVYMHHIICGMNLGVKIGAQGAKFNVLLKWVWLNIFEMIRVSLPDVVRMDAHPSGPSSKKHVYPAQP